MRFRSGVTAGPEVFDSGGYGPPIPNQASNGPSFTPGGYPDFDNPGPGPTSFRPESSFGQMAGYFPPQAPPPLAPSQAPRLLSSYQQSFNPSPMSPYPSAQPSLYPSSYPASPYQPQPSPYPSAFLPYSPSSSQPSFFPNSNFLLQQDNLPPSPGFGAFGGSMLEIETTITKKT